MVKYFLTHSNGTYYRDKIVRSQDNFRNILTINTYNILTKKGSGGGVENRILMPRNRF